MTVKIQRKAKFAVISTAQLRAISPLSDEDVISAQSHVSKEMIAALEEMVNAAKAGRVKGDEVLAFGAVAWAGATV
ncbi:hypothetical protein A4U53_004395 (plasmid) [Rhizobium ruizarguesonis]|uniref:Uncharacterized protein n=3 Tax=Rhizobium TaxID=379 RepID=A0A179BZB8_RHILE|nr:hypothetical protein [Rhizobium leguminosarum]OAP97067.1 hypothetical protein A4U53_37180 [Rhizobium leguminosarum]